MIRRLRKFSFCQSGMAALETALILPILAALGLAATDAGMMMLTLHKMETGLAAGGSFLARSRDLINDQQAAKNVAVTGHNASGYDPVVAGWSASDVSVYIVDVPNAGGDQSLVLRGGDGLKIARVESSISYKGLGFLSMMNTGAITLKARHEERIFGGLS